MENAEILKEDLEFREDKTPDEDEEQYYRGRTFFGLGERGRFMAYLVFPAVLVMVLFQVVPIIVGFN
jgi:hypothetical protein